MVGCFEDCDEFEKSTMIKIPKSEVFANEQIQDSQERSDQETSESDRSDPERKFLLIFTSISCLEFYFDLPRATREAKKKRSVHQLPRAKREA